MTTERTLHQILLQPTDVLFFRDGRPMSGSLAGHTAAWPLPDVINHALHAALHRADLESTTGQKLHLHRRGRNGNYDDTQRDKKFGSLLTVGPFPVHLGQAAVRPLGAASGPSWFFPRPKDSQINGSVAVTLRPVRSLTKADDDPWLGSSLPDPLEYAVVSAQPPSKETGGEPWISKEAFDAYLTGDSNFKPTEHTAHFLRDSDLADTEYAIGIGIDPTTQTQDKTNFYSAHYLRLRDQFRLGIFAEAMDKVDGGTNTKRDLITALLNEKPQSIIVGGQQRLCTAQRAEAPTPLPLPRGLISDFHSVELKRGKRWLVKWVLLTPAIWPEMRGDGITPHHGGWLPNWVAEDEQSFDGETVAAGSVLLLDGPGKEKAKRRKLVSGKRISARLVAAVVPKPIVITGWALGDPHFNPEIEDQSESRSGAKSTHLAVPPGAVYYFEADSEPDARHLAAALNWHGSGDGSEIKNRRSTLLGEKGYGLGVCGTWDFYDTSTKS